MTNTDRETRRLLAKYDSLLEGPTRDPVQAALMYKFNGRLRLAVEQRAAAANDVANAAAVPPTDAVRAAAAELAPLVQRDPAELEARLAQLQPPTPYTHFRELQRTDPIRAAIHYREHCDAIERSRPDEET